MEYVSAYYEVIAANWQIWFVTITLIVAAVIDGFELKVPNWLTYPMIISGWVFSALFADAMPWYQGLGWSLLGSAVGLLLLLIPAYVVGGMGAGDVKLLAGVGAWIHTTHTIWAFAYTAIIGGVLAVLMVLLSGQWQKHYDQFWFILNEIKTVKDPERLAQIAAGRKSSMMLLPYGIPIALGTIAYFAWNNMLVQ
jgi:prepilin peptidase CpaA